MNEITPPPVSRTVQTELRDLRITVNQLNRQVLHLRSELEKEQKKQEKVNRKGPQRVTIVDPIGTGFNVGLGILLIPVYGFCIIVAILSALYVLGSIFAYLTG